MSFSTVRNVFAACIVVTNREFPTSVLPFFIFPTLNYFCQIFLQRHWHWSSISLRNTFSLFCFCLLPSHVITLQAFGLITANPDLRQHIWLPSTFAATPTLLDLGISVCLHWFLLSRSWIRLWDLTKWAHTIGFSWTIRKVRSSYFFSSGAHFTQLVAVFWLFGW